MTGGAHVGVECRGNRLEQSMMFKKAMAVLLFGTLAVWGTFSAVQAKDIRWGTSRVGSSGHRAVTNLSNVMKGKLGDYQITVQPTPGAILTVKGYTVGKFEGYYGSDIAFYEFANNIKRFKGFKAQASSDPVQSFWTFTIEMGVGIHARDVGKITSWGQLNGVDVFTGPRPWDTRAQLERAFGVLGINHNYKEVSIKTAGSLLESGSFKAFGVYTNAEATTSGWIQQANLQTDWASLNPSPAEVRKLEAAGFKVVQVPTKVFGKRKTHVVKATMLPFYYGLHLGMDVPENDMYRILKAIEANAAELAKADKAFKQVARDMPGMQVRGVTAAANLVRIHPGLAKYMREKGIWQSKWNSRIAR